MTLPKHELDRRRRLRIERDQMRALTETRIIPGMGVINDASQLPKTVQIIEPRDYYDEQGRFVITFINIYRALRTAQLSGDCRMVLDWIIENIAGQHGNVTYEATLSKIAEECVAPRKIQRSRVSLLLSQLERHNFIMRSESARSTIFVNPHYHYIGNAKNHRIACELWDQMYAARSVRQMRKLARAM